MADWQPIETAPENTLILCWSSYNDSFPFHVDSFRWTVEIETDVESETRNAKGRRRIIQEHEKRVREWRSHYGAEYWMRLPEPPTT